MSKVVTIPDSEAIKVIAVGPQGPQGPPGPGGTINTSSFATTGSNQFNGNQVITGSLYVANSTTPFVSQIIHTSGTYTGPFNDYKEGYIWVENSYTEMFLRNEDSQVSSYSDLWLEYNQIAAELIYNSQSGLNLYSTYNLEPGYSEMYSTLDTSSYNSEAYLYLDGNNGNSGAANAEIYTSYSSQSGDNSYASLYTEIDFTTKTAYAELYASDLLNNVQTSSGIFFQNGLAEIYGNHLLIPHISGGAVVSGSFTFIGEVSSSSNSVYTSISANENSVDIFSQYDSGSDSIYSGIFADTLNGLNSGVELYSTKYINGISEQSTFSLSGKVASLNGQLELTGSFIQGPSTTKMPYAFEVSGTLFNTTTINFSESYGDVTFYFPTNSYIAIYDLPGKTINPYKISQSYYETNKTVVKVYGYPLFYNSQTYVFPGDKIVNYVGAGGNKTVVGSNVRSHGFNCYALGYGSYAQGRSSAAIGDYSHAEGFSSGKENDGSTAVGVGSHAEGISTLALGFGSHAEGVGTIAEGDYQHVSGMYNTPGDSSSLFIVGNGTFNNPSDAFKIRQQGSIILPVTSSNTPGWTGTQGEMIFGTDGSGKYVIWAYIGGAWRSGSLV